MICIGDSLTLGMVGHSYIKYCRPAATGSVGEVAPNGTLDFAKSSGYAKTSGYAEIPESAEVPILNRGVNGDTTRCAFERMEYYLAKPSYDDQDTYVIAIGTNDVLLPYLAKLSPAWKAETSLRCRIKKCIDEDEVFRQEYEKYFIAIERYNAAQNCGDLDTAQNGGNLNAAQNCGGLDAVQGRGVPNGAQSAMVSESTPRAACTNCTPRTPKKMITIGLPYIELNGYPLDTVRRHNEIIRELSEKYEVPYIDMYSLQCEVTGYAEPADSTGADEPADNAPASTGIGALPATTPSSTTLTSTGTGALPATAPTSYTWKHKNIIRLIANLAMLVCPPVKDMLSRARKLKLTVDGVHYNSLSAEILGKALYQTQARYPRNTK